mmetsp:Transcript_114595/g.335102  ORF Transcript_114595/g.335102 Transcript_114595/m.335102 type:complete len:239 (+) Transcript_114595:1878-2594(+)
MLDQEVVQRLEDRILPQDGLRHVHAPAHVVRKPWQGLHPQLLLGPTRPISPPYRCSLGGLCASLAVLEEASHLLDVCSGGGNPECARQRPVEDVYEALPFFTVLDEADVKQVCAVEGLKPRRRLPNVHPWPLWSVCALLQLLVAIFAGRNCSIFRARCLLGTLLCLGCLLLAAAFKRDSFLTHTQVSQLLADSISSGKVTLSPSLLPIAYQSLNLTIRLTCSLLCRFRPLCDIATRRH